MTVNRQLAIDLSDTIVQPQDYPQLRSMGDAVTRDLRSQFMWRIQELSATKMNRK